MGSLPHTILRLDLPSQGAHQESSASGPCLVGVDVGIGLVAADDRCLLHHRRADVGVKVQSHGNWQVRGDLPNAREELSFPIVVAFGHHGTMEIEKCRITASSHRLTHGVGHGIESRILHRSTRCRGTGNGQ